MEITLLALGVIGGPLFLLWAGLLWRKNKQLREEVLDLKGLFMQHEHFRVAFAAWHLEDRPVEAMKALARLVRAWDELPHKSDYEAVVTPFPGSVS